MRLLIERSERGDWLGRPVYRLRASLVCDAVTLALIERHHIAGDLLWQAPSAVALNEAAEGHFDNARALSWLGHGNAMKGLQWNIRGLWLASRAAREARISVGDLVHGIELEARALGEVLAVEGGIAAGFDALAEHVSALASYDAGDEWLVDPARDDERGTAPAVWLHMSGQR